jgi:hypothetical protein
METTYFFEELKISEFGVGALLYGQALLKSDSNGGWYVDEIVFQNGHVIYQGSPTVLDREMFKAITEVLYDDRIPADGSLTHGCMAASEWADAVSERRRHDHLSQPPRRHEHHPTDAQRGRTVLWLLHGSRSSRRPSHGR